MSSFHYFIFFFERVKKGELKMKKGEEGRIKNGKYQLLKTGRFRYIVISLKS